MVTVIEVHHLSHRVRINHLGTKTGTAAEDPRFKHFVTQRLPHSDAVMEKLHIE